MDAIRSPPTHCFGSGWFRTCVSKGVTASGRAGTGAPGQLGEGQGWGEIRNDAHEPHIWVRWCPCRGAPWDGRQGTEKVPGAELHAHRPATDTCHAESTRRAMTSDPPASSGCDVSSGPLPCHEVGPGTSIISWGLMRKGPKAGRHSSAHFTSQAAPVISGTSRSHVQSVRLSKPLGCSVSVS